VDHAHVGIYGNKMADQLTKATARNRHTTISLNRIPKSTLYNEIEEEATQKWRKEWENCKQAAITKQFFSNIHERLKLNIHENPNFTAMVTGHGKTGSYLHRFNIIENAACPCNKEDQTIDLLLYQCTLLQKQREFLGITF
jgi:post-segregation antitoxin (ccd killing protein)